MTSLTLSAPGGATVLGSETAGPPGWARGTGGWVNRSRSRPGCALGGMTCAIAAVETIAIASAAAMRPNPANIPAPLTQPGVFTRKTIESIGPQPICAIDHVIIVELRPFLRMLL